jgi:lysophospholipase L1-like esterase
MLFVFHMKIKFFFEKYFKILLCLIVASLVLNFYVAFLLVKRIYYSKKYKVVVNIKDNLIHYSFDRQSVYDIFPLAKNDIVFIGDSHVQKFDLDDFFPGQQIKNRGIDGDISAGVFNRLYQIEMGKPRKLFIEIGFNDLHYGITPDSVINNVKKIILTLNSYSPNTIIYFNNILPCDKILEGRNLKPLIMTFNQKLRALCIKYNTFLIDIHSKLANSNDGLEKNYDCGDGIHLNGKGYLVWSNVLKHYL